MFSIFTYIMSRVTHSELGLPMSKISRSGVGEGQYPGVFLIMIRSQVGLVSLTFRYAYNLKPHKDEELEN